MPASRSLAASMGPAASVAPGASAASGTSAASTAPGIAPERTEAPSDQRDRPWNVVVWNDPVTLMSYVVYVLRKLFGFDEPKATRLMLQIHHEGRAIVASGPREHSEMNVHRLHAHGLQATLTQE